MSTQKHAVVPLPCLENNTFLSKMNDVVLNVTASEFVSFTREIFLSFVDIASDRNIKYRFNSNEKTIPLWFDKNQLEKVIFNLLSNAFKFTD
ncbi:MAG: HAMP domain-containing histidine kinase, partial [Planctomycetes bacterium]|nr:HAMP domain-containing histidine kinase [Planctomycetota bacterium]